MGFFFIFLVGLWTTIFLFLLSIETINSNTWTNSPVPTIPKLSKWFRLSCFFINRNKPFSDLESNTLNKYFDEMEAGGYMPKPKRKTLQ